MTEKTAIIIIIVLPANSKQIIQLPFVPIADNFRAKAVLLTPTIQSLTEKQVKFVIIKREFMGFKLEDIKTQINKLYPTTKDVMGEGWIFICPLFRCSGVDVKQFKVRIITQDNIERNLDFIETKVKKVGCYAFPACSIRKNSTDFGIPVKMDIHNINRIEFIWVLSDGACSYQCINPFFKGDSLFSIDNIFVPFNEVDEAVTPYDHTTLSFVVKVGKPFTELQTENEGAFDIFWDAISLLQHTFWEKDCDTLEISEFTALYKELTE